MPDKHISPKSPSESTTDGLSIKRVFSTQGENPLDSVDWERRDAVIKNPQGESVFEQKDVEFPKDWSPLGDKCRGFEILLWRPDKCIPGSR